MKRCFIFGLVFFVCILCVNAQNTKKNYRVYYEEIMEPNLSKIPSGHRDTRGQAIHQSTLIISVEGYLSIDIIYRTVADRLGYSYPGVKIGDEYHSAKSDVKYLKFVGYTSGIIFPQFYELRITNYEELK